MKNAATEMMRTSLMGFLEAVEALPDPPAQIQAQALEAARSAEMTQERPMLWVNVQQITGGYQVILCMDPIETPMGLQTPDGSNRRFMCASFDEVIKLLRSRFGEAAR